MEMKGHCRAKKGVEKTGEFGISSRTALLQTQFLREPITILEG